MILLLYQILDVSAARLICAGGGVVLVIDAHDLIPIIQYWSFYCIKSCWNHLFPFGRTFFLFWWVIFWRWLGIKLLQLLQNVNILKAWIIKNIDTFHFICQTIFFLFFIMAEFCAVDILRFGWLALIKDEIISRQLNYYGIIKLHQWWIIFLGYFICWLLKIVAHVIIISFGRRYLHVWVISSTNALFLNLNFLAWICELIHHL